MSFRKKNWLISASRRAEAATALLRGRYLLSRPRCAGWPACDTPARMLECYKSPPCVLGLLLPVDVVCRHRWACWGLAVVKPGQRNVTFMRTVGRGCVPSAEGSRFAG